MTLRTRLGLGVITAFLVAALMPYASIAAPAPDRPHAKPAPAEYLYSASFSATVLYDLHLDYGAPNYETRNAYTTVWGTLPDVRAGSGSRQLVPVGPAGQAKVQTEDSWTDNTTVTDDGLYSDRCTGSSADVGGLPVMDPRGLGTFKLYGSLAFPTTCQDNQGHTGTGTYFLPELSMTAVPWGGHEFGDAVVKLKLYGDVIVAPGHEIDDPYDCPGYEGDRTVSCSYQAAGFLTLKLIKKLTSEDSAKGAKVTSKKATVKIVCPSRCTIQLDLTTLNGGLTVAVERIKLKPRKPRTITVPIPPKKRDIVKRSGGVRIKITYHMSGVPKFSETRLALL